MANVKPPISLADASAGRKSPSDRKKTRTPPGKGHASAQKISLVSLEQALRLQAYTISTSRSDPLFSRPEQQRQGFPSAAMPITGIHKKPRDK